MAFNQGSMDPQGSASAVQGLLQKLHKYYDRQCEDVNWGSSSNWNVSLWFRFGKKVEKYCSKISKVHSMHLGPKIFGVH